MAIAAGIKPENGDVSTVVPILSDRMFPARFAGVAFAAVGIGVLVPAASMSSAAANLLTRNIYVEFIRPDATPAQQARVSKLASLVVKLGALLFIIGLNPRFAIDLQLIGGVLILQTLPSVGVGLFTRWPHRTALIAGRVAGMSAGLWMLYTIPNPATHHAHFGGSAFNLATLGGPALTLYAGFISVIVNVVVVVRALRQQVQPRRANRHCRAR